MRYTQPNNMRSFRRNVTASMVHFECSICYDHGTTNDACILECGHTFHHRCAVEWKDNAERPSCPLCRGPLRSKETSPCEICPVQKNLERAFANAATIEAASTAHQVVSTNYLNMIEEVNRMIEDGNTIEAMYLLDFIEDHYEE